MDCSLAGRAIHTRKSVELRRPNRRAHTFWTADDKTWYRNTERQEPRDNLVFEAGLFIATHGRNRTQLMVPLYGDNDARKETAVPSDVAGMTWNQYAWADGAVEATGLPHIGTPCV